MANFVTIIHETKDFAAWKKVYDADAPNRKAAGLTELQVLREHDNPNVVALMFGVADVSAAKAFAGSPKLADAMKAGGVVGTPRVRFRHGEHTDVRTVSNAATMNLKVRDYATAIKAYAMDAAERKNAGLTDLYVLQLDDDPTDLVLIWSVADVGRAKAFFNSAALAEHMVKNAGVVGTPERHFWKP